MPSSRPDARAPSPPEDDDSDDDTDEDSGDDDAPPANGADAGAEPDQGDAGAGDEEPDPMDGDDDMEPPAGGGEVITTAEGTKIYLDPSCENVTLDLMGRMLEFVGCCIEGMNMCGVSTHKLMIPAQFASMFPHKCRGYEDAMMIPGGVMTPEPKSCTIPK